MTKKHSDFKPMYSQGVVSDIPRKGMFSVFVQTNISGGFVGESSGRILDADEINYDPYNNFSTLIKDVSKANREMIEKLYKAADSILSLQIDWDGMDAKAFLPNNVIKLKNIIRLYEENIEAASHEVLVPKVIPGNDGQIGLYFKTSQLILLISVSESGLVDYFRKDSMNEHKDVINADHDCVGLFNWLANHDFSKH